MTVFEDELLRLVGHPSGEVNWRAAMWRRSYCIALNAIKVLEARVTTLRRSHWDAPMIFFYPDQEHG